MNFVVGFLGLLQGGDNSLPGLSGNNHPAEEFPTFDRILEDLTDIDSLPHRPP